MKTNTCRKPNMHCMLIDHLHNKPLNCQIHKLNIWQCHLMTITFYFQKEENSFVKCFSLFKRGKLIHIRHFPHFFTIVKWRNFVKIISIFKLFWGRQTEHQSHPNSLILKPISTCLCVCVSKLTAQINARALNK